MFTEGTVTGKMTTLDVALRVGIVVGALTTAVIHYSLGSTLFLLNAIGFAVLAIALVAPLAIAERFEWLTRLALLGFTAATIVGWVLFGARYETAYIATGTEVLMVALLGAEIVRAGGIRAIVDEARALFGGLRRAAGLSH